jgi:Putative addiction module component.
MAISIEQLTQAALSLPSDARAQLADRLVESLAPGRDDEVQVAWTAEATRRRNELRRGDVQPVPGNEALQRVRDSLAR